MLLSSWNVNSVRARIENILSYLKAFKPDILMIQEIKTEEKNFPFSSFKAVGYDSFVFGQKSYNGVAFLSKINLENVEKNFLKDNLNQSRTIACDLRIKNKKIKLINIYTPNGNPIDTEKYLYKKNWLNLFIKKMKKIINKYENIIIGGDFNIIPDEIDVYNSKRFENDALFKLDIRKKFRELLNMGFKDIYRFKKENVQEYTFWDYMYGSWAKNYGMRIDHFLVSSNLLSSVKKININKKPRSMIKPSDHTPIELEIT